jgi:hypothetical protein
MDATLQIAKYDLQLPVVPATLALDSSVDEIINFQFPVPKSFELEYNVCCCYRFAVQ